MMPRRISKTIKIGDVAVGGGAPVVVQSMTKTDTRDVKATAIARIYLDTFSAPSYTAP